MTEAIRRAGRIRTSLVNSRTLAGHWGHPRFPGTREWVALSAPWQYAWSTCRAYASGAADPLLVENSFYLEWGGDDGGRQQRWREFLTHEDPKEPSIRGADRVVGDESFQKRLQGHQRRAVQRRLGRPPKSGRQEAAISS